MKVPADVVSGEGLLPGLQMAFSFEGKRRERGSKLSHVSPDKGTNPIHQDSTLITQLPHKGPAA